MSRTEMEALYYIAIVAIVTGVVKSYSTTPFYPDIPNRRTVRGPLDTSELDIYNLHVYGSDRGTYVHLITYKISTWFIYHPLSITIGVAATH